MKPKAIRSLTMVRGTDGLLRLEMVDAGREVVLDPLAELVWDLSDGSRSLEALAQAAGQAFDRVVPQEEVFSALDFLADAGLIEERVAPPVAEGKVSRRSLLVQIAPVVGAGACMMLGASATAGGLFQESNKGEKAAKANDAAEKAAKANELARKTEAENRERDEKLEKEINEAGKRSRIENQPRGGIVKEPGRVDNTGKYAVRQDHPLVGKWKCIQYYDWAWKYRATGRCNETCIEFTLIWTISSRGILKAQQSTNWEGQNNWKYSSTSPDAGTLEGFSVVEESKGETLSWRGDIRWISKNEFEYTTTFSTARHLIGQRRRFVRQ